LKTKTFAAYYSAITAEFSPHFNILRPSQYAIASSLWTTS